MMRVLHLSTYIGRASGGLGSAVRGLAATQIACGCDAVVWCPDTPAEIGELRRAPGTECNLNPLPVIGPSALGYSLVAQREAAGAASRRYDICHQHGLWMAHSCVTQRWRAASRRPTVISPHGMLRSQALKRSSWKKWIAALLYEAHNLRQAACLHATSDVEAASFRAYGLQNPIALIPLGISPNWLEGVGDGARFCRKNAIPGDTRIMLFLSRIHPIKGLPLLLEALARIRSLLDGWHLAIVGPDEGGHGRELQRLAQRLGITDLVTFGDAVFGDDKRDAFAAAELFVLPTNSENFSFAVAEALGAGVPVITTQGAPWQDLLGYHCGWWIDISTTALQDALVAATRLSRAELVEMGQRGRDLVARKYTWRQVGEQSLMLYEWLLGRSDRPSFVITD